MSDRINDIDNREETNENLSSEEILNRVAETLDDYRGDDVDLTKYIPVKWLEANEELYYTNDPQDRQIRKHYMDVRSSWEISGANQWKELLAGKISEKSLYWGKNHIDYMRDTTDMYCYNGVNLDSLHYIIPGKELAPYDGTVTLHRFCNEALQYRYAIYVLSTEVKRVPLREKDAMIKEWEDLYKNDPITFSEAGRVQKAELQRQERYRSISHQTDEEMQYMYTWRLLFRHYRSSLQMYSER